MRFLLTNDDGIDAPGLLTLERVVEELNASFVTVAPHQHLSGCSHQVTVSTGISLTPAGPNRYALTGTPADCVRVALNYLGEEVDYVLAGINDGGNLGVDIFMSGTVAAAREAALLGRPAIALSQFQRRMHESNWQGAGEMAFRVLQDLVVRSSPIRGFWNVNFPSEQQQDTQQVGIVECPVDKSPHNIAYDMAEGSLFFRGNYQQRQHAMGTDVGRCFAGKITVSMVEL